MTQDHNLKKEMTKVLIADDSMLMRILIKDLLSTDASLEVVGVANNGQQAVSLTQQLKPDVVLMDMNMGEYGGAYGIQQIMQQCPTPIIILSAAGNTDMDVIMDALVLGAVDYVNKPVRNSANMEEIGATLIEKIKTSSKISLKPPQHKPQITNVHSHAFDAQLTFEIIVIGASTGGPTAIEQIIANLPQNLPIPVVIVQHMPDHFIPSFAERLDKLSPLSIAVATKGQTLEKGKILLVPGHCNTILKLDAAGNVVVDFTQERYKAYNYPSVDAVMLSAAEIFGRKTLAVLLTGMGRDGALGMKAVKDAGGFTVAQSEDTCAVYGMPRAAVEEGAVSQIVKLKDIGSFLVCCL